MIFKNLLKINTSNNKIYISNKCNKILIYTEIQIINLNNFNNKIHFNLQCLTLINNNHIINLA